MDTIKLSMVQMVVDICPWNEVKLNININSPLKTSIWNFLISELLHHISFSKTLKLDFQMYVKQTEYTFYMNAFWKVGTLHFSHNYVNITGYTET